MFNQIKKPPLLTLFTIIIIFTVLAILRSKTALNHTTEILLTINSILLIIALIFDRIRSNRSKENAPNIKTAK